MSFLKSNKDTPMYVVIQNDIITAINNNTLLPGDKLKTEKEFSQQYNVSRTTVVKALSELANTGIITRTAGKGSFVNKDTTKLTSVHEARVPAGNKNIIGYIAPMIKDSFSTSILNGILDKLRETDFSLIIKVSETHINEIKYVEELLSIGAEGIIVFPIDYELYNPKILDMARDNYPLVLIDRTLPGICTHDVINDNVAGMNLAVDHLYSLGHRKICFCTTSPFQIQPIAQRFTAFNDRVLTYNSNTQPCLLKDIVQDYENFEANPQLVQMLTEGNVTAYICADSSVAMYVYAVAKHLGKQIPKDLSLISFDDPAPSYGDLKFFTFVKQNGTALGQKAADILLSQIEGKVKQGFYVHSVLSPTLEINRSTAAPPTGRKDSYEYERIFEKNPNG